MTGIGYNIGDMCFERCSCFHDGRQTGMSSPPKPLVKESTHPFYISVIPQIAQVFLNCPGTTYLQVLRTKYFEFIRTAFGHVFTAPQPQVFGAFQSVITEFEDGGLATHDMITGTARPGRSIHLVGTQGEIEGLMEDGKFVVRHPDARAGHEYSEDRVDLSVSENMHGGGDMRLVEDFIHVVRGEPASISTTGITDSIYGHLIAFAADAAMLNRRVVEIEDLETPG